MIFRGLNWIPSSAYAPIQPNAVVAGHDIDGATIYVGRAFHEGDLIPAKVIPSKKVAFIPYGGQEFAKYEYQVLCGVGLNWVQSRNGSIPADAVSSGTQRNGEVLYVGRTNINGSLTTGKIHPSHNCIYVPFDGNVYSFGQYEVLIAPKCRSTWIQSTKYSSLPEGAIFAGFDQDQSPMYVGRAWHGGDLLPAKVLPTKRACYVGHGGIEISKDQFEVLCYGHVSWVKCNPSTRSVPPSALNGGYTSNHEPLYIGRTYYQGSLTVGKVHISHGVLYISIPFGGSEVSIHSEIEILIEK